MVEERALGPLFILHIVDRYNLHLDSAIFVSPFLAAIDTPGFDAINKTFYRHDFDFKKLRRLIPISYTFYSDNDQYVSSALSKGFAKKLGSKTIVVKNGGHLNSEAGFTKFVLLLELAQESIA